MSSSTKRSWSVKKTFTIIMVVIMVMICATIGFIWHLLNKDPAKEASGIAINKLYETAAFQASVFNGSVKNGASIEQLKEYGAAFDQRGGTISFEPPTIEDNTKITWHAKIVSQGDYQAFLGQENTRSYGCIVYAVNIVTKTVSTAPLDCSKQSDDSSVKYIQIDVHKVAELRKKYHDLAHCYETIYQPSAGGLNASAYDCTNS
jgi:hypothetical protein